MKRSILKAHAILLACTISVAVSAQLSYWSTVKDTGLSRTTLQKKKNKLPEDYKLFRLQAAPLHEQLFSITGTKRRQSSTVIFLPNASGAVERYEVSESSNFDAALQARYPSIRSFSGRSLDNPGARLRLTTNAARIQAMVQRANNAAEWIELYSQDPAIYAVYKRQPGAARQWRCGTRDQAMVNSPVEGNGTQARNGNSSGSLRTIRLAITCSGEFAQEHGVSGNGTPADIEDMMFKIQEVVNMVNEIFERDLSVHLQLADQTRNALFFNPDTDPYDPVIWPDELNGYSEELMDAAQQELDARVGGQNYDIGTLFCISNSNSVADLNSVCVNGNKGRSYVTPLYDNEGGINWVDYYLIFAHEVGHQLGAWHTFSHVTDNDGGFSSQQVEPGSGITIMGYPGIALYPFNVNDKRIPCFHPRSIEAMWDHLNTVNCPVTTDISQQNTPPVIVQPANRTIPKSTPFALTALANGAAGEILTYRWDQVDSAAVTDVYGNSLAYPEKETGPNWVSMMPDVNPTRYFPMLSTILDGKFTSEYSEGDPNAVMEALSSVGRTLNFRLLVCDGVSYNQNPLRVAQSAYTDMAVTVDGNSGPFRVTSQNNEESYIKGSAQLITWSVNGTNVAPVNCTNVRILFSADGGQNFNFVLSNNTVNDGAQMVTLPNVETFEGRIKIEAIGNIFFDISDRNISLLPPVGFGFGATEPASTSCAGANSLTVQLPVISNGGYNGVVELSVINDNLPPGVTININSNPIQAGGMANITLQNVHAMPVGNYYVKVLGIGEPPGNIQLSKTTEFIITPSALGPQININPLNRTVCAGNDVVFSCFPSQGLSCSYQWQIKRPPSTVFTDMSVATYPSVHQQVLTLPSVQEDLNECAFRCIVSNFCGSDTSLPAVLRVATIPDPSQTNETEEAFTCAGGDIYINIDWVAGLNLNYQWQVKVPGGDFQNITNNQTAITKVLALQNVPVSMHGFEYRCKVYNACGEFYPYYGKLNVYRINPPQSQNVCPGSTVQFLLDDLSAPDAVYRWQVKQGAGGFTDITGNPTASSARLILQNVTASMNSNEYRCVTSSQTCSDHESPPATLAVSSISITSQPQNRTVCTGQNTIISVTATGIDLRYQWKVKTATSGWSVIPGATASTLTLSNVTASMNNNKYHCVLSKPGCSSVTTAEATLTVRANLQLRFENSNKEGCQGGSTSFTISTGIAGSFGYQWQVKTITQDWSDMTGQTTSTLSLSNLTMAMNNYQYRCKVTQNGCTTTSGVARVSVKGFTSQPANAYPCPGGEARFSVQVSGQPQSYRWYVIPVGGAPISPVDAVANPSAATRELVLANVNASQRGNYYFCKVTYAAPSCTINSASGGLIVQQAPVISTQPYNQTVCAGNDAQFRVETYGGPYTYRWEQKLPNSANYTTINSASASTNTLLMQSVLLSANGTKIRCVITNNTCNISTTSGIVTLTVEPVRIISQPVPVTQACEGGRAFFSVGVNCTTPVLYQWAVKTPGSSSIVHVMNNPSATTNTLLLSNLTRDMHNNKYICLIYNSTSLLSTNMVSLQLLDRISATINSPAALQICRGSSTTLSVSTTGPVTGYQWEHAPLLPSGGNMAFSEIPSANSSTLSFTGAFAGYLRHGCKYRCKVFSLCENITSGITTIVNVNCELRQLLTRQEAGLPAQYTAPDKDSSAIPVNAEAIILYPVPNSGTFSIRMNTDQYPSIDLNIYDQSGRLLVSRQVRGLVAGSVIPVTVPHAVNGLYQLRISNTAHPEKGAVVKTFLIAGGLAAIK